LYIRCFIAITNLVALILTFSRSLINPILYGFHTACATDDIITQNAFAVIMMQKICLWELVICICDQGNAKVLNFVFVNCGAVAADIVQRRKLHLSDGHVLTARWPTQSEGSFADPRTVEVTAVMKHVDQKLLYMYFENEAKSGGGPVEKIVPFDDSTAYVTFESSEGTMVFL